MYAKNFTIDDRGEGEEVEDLTAGFPDGGIAVFLLALLVETVDLGDLPGLVIATDERDLVRISADQVSQLKMRQQGMEC